MKQLEMFTPQLGDLLCGARSVSGTGVEEWFWFPRYHVVAFHMNDESMFVETLNEQQEVIGHTIMPLDSNQWNFWS